ncbi:MAG: GH36 C-terminal domain-containing protein [Bacteroidetes bacterium]|nr:GH36 C-terminal domain-containing protein [Bacteroidota bacterium]
MYPNLTKRFEFSYSIAPIQFAGLDPVKKYRIKELNVYPETSSTINAAAVYSGEYLMNVGFNPDLNLKRSSVILEINAVK